MNNSPKPSACVTNKQSSFLGETGFQAISPAVERRSAMPIGRRRRAFRRTVGASLLAISVSMFQQAPIARKRAPTTAALSNRRQKGLLQLRFNGARRAGGADLGDGVAAAHAAAFEPSGGDGAGAA